jgi:hypothetical protein
MVLPFSSVTIRASSSRDSFTSLKNSATYSCRLARGVRRHELKALWAALMASRTSSAVEAWNEATLLPRKAGFSSSNVASLREAVHFPLMKFL